MVGDTQSLHGQRPGSGADIKGRQRSVTGNAAGVCWTEFEEGFQLFHNKDARGKAVSSKPSQIHRGKQRGEKNNILWNIVFCTIISCSFCRQIRKSCCVTPLSSSPICLISPIMGLWESLHLCLFFLWHFQWLLCEYSKFVFNILQKSFIRSFLKCKLKIKGVKMLFLTISPQINHTRPSCNNKKKRKIQEN